MGQENPIETVLGALRNAKGDDTYRAKMTFKNYSPEKMQTEFGMSGKSCSQILQEYEDHDRKIDEAIEWVKRK